MKSNHKANVSKNRKAINKTVVPLNEVFLRPISIYNGQIFSWDESFNDPTCPHWINDLLNDPDELSDTSPILGSA
jgi:hypothetical protein